MGYLELGFPYDLACVALVDLLCGQGLDLHGAGWFGLVNVYRQFNWSLTLINRERVRHGRAGSPDQRGLVLPPKL